MKVRLKDQSLGVKRSLELDVSNSDLALGVEILVERTSFYAVVAYKADAISAAGENLEYVDGLCLVVFVGGDERSRSEYFGRGSHWLRPFHRNCRLAVVSA